MAEGEDLCVTGVSCGKDPSESVENKANQSRKQGHERRRVTASAMPKTCGITGRMNLRHPQPQRHRRTVPLVQRLPPPDLGRCRHRHRSTPRQRPRPETWSQPHRERAAHRRRRRRLRPAVRTSKRCRVHQPTPRRHHVARPRPLRRPRPPTRQPARLRHQREQRRRSRTPTTTRHRHRRLNAPPHPEPHRRVCAPTPELKPAAFCPQGSPADA